jgi:hypothetical protein
LGLGTSNDEWGHGITELEFEKLILTVRPGPNEDYILVEGGSPRDLDAEYWTLIEAQQVSNWAGYLGLQLESIDLYTDGREDVALVFHLEDGRSFSIVLCDTDLSMAQALEPFGSALESVTPQLRERLRADREQTSAD